jgi:hypothetical protein
VAEWNALRRDVIARAVDSFLIPNAIAQLAARRKTYAERTSKYLTPILL